VKQSKDSVKEKSRGNSNFDVARASRLRVEGEAAAPDGAKSISAAMLIVS
jgi:hypothetical protein